MRNSKVQEVQIKSDGNAKLETTGSSNSALAVAEFSCLQSTDEVSQAVIVR